MWTPPFLYSKIRIHGLGDPLVDHLKICYIARHTIILREDMNWWKIERRTFASMLQKYKCKLLRSVFNSTARSRDSGWILGLEDSRIHTNKNSSSSPLENMKVWERRVPLRPWQRWTGVGRRGLPEQEFVPLRPCKGGRVTWGGIRPLRPWQRLREWRHILPVPVPDSGSLHAGWCTGPFSPDAAQ